ncbi:MAG: endolytic transglycosylase MltG, partial [Myxococcales bacterium]|nr:endolytic transglycosylase MltG [Myxococcales bacterium]
EARRGEGSRRGEPSVVTQSVKRTTAKPKSRARRSPGGKSKRPAGGRATWRRWLVAALGASLLPLGAFVVWAHSGGDATRAVRFEVDPYEQRAQLIQRLHAAGLVQSPTLFGWYLTFAGEVEPGPHLLGPGLSAAELGRRLTRSRGRQVQKLSIPEGLNLFQIAERAETAQICSARDFIGSARKQTLLDELGIEHAQSVEGYLFPATYDFPADSRPEDVIRRLVRETRKRLRSLGESPYVKRRGWGEHEVLTLASMIEKEAQVPEERALISSVFHNRLDSPDFEKRRYLQSDPTSAYACYAEPERVPACQGFSGKVTPALNRDPANRYSTYVVQGLPPGPIANPGEAAIEAAVAPAKTDYLFFVARGGGRHHFSRTYAEHQRAVESP